MRKIVTGFFTGMALGGLLGGYYMGHKYCLELMDSRDLSEKRLHMVRLYDVWMMTKGSGRTIEGYLLDKDIRTVAIYGMSFMGIRLFHELKGSPVCVKYGLDHDPKARIPGLGIYRLGQREKVDAVIVADIFAFDSIKADLKRRGFARIIALDEMLYDLVQH